MCRRKIRFNSYWETKLASVEQNRICGKELFCSNSLCLQNYMNIFSEFIPLSVFASLQEALGVTHSEEIESPLLSILARPCQCVISRHKSNEHTWSVNTQGRCKKFIFSLAFCSVSRFRRQKDLLGRIEAKLVNSGVLFFHILSVDAESWTWVT